MRSTTIRGYPCDRDRHLGPGGDPEGGARYSGNAALLEAQLVVISQLGDSGLAELEMLLSQAQIQPVPYESNHLHWALHGWRHYGRGCHKAALNLGDCFSNGLAKALDAPLLFKGGDF